MHFNVHLVNKSTTPEAATSLFVVKKNSQLDIDSRNKYSYKYLLHANQHVTSSFTQCSFTCNVFLIFLHVYMGQLSPHLSLCHGWVSSGCRQSKLRLLPNRCEFQWESTARLTTAFLIKYQYVLKSLWLSIYSLKTHLCVSKYIF